MDLIKNFKKTMTSYNPVLGINTRNQRYVRPYNFKKGKEIADDKLLCKRILRRNNLPINETYKIIYVKKQLDMIHWKNLPKSFVIKPNEGTAGNGIIVLIGKKKGKLEWIKASGETLNVEQIKRHITDILDGRYSMGNRKDIAFFEELTLNHRKLKKYSYKGIPDVRVIVFNQIPVMAMIRLPTRKSDGKANVHAGAIAVGIDIATGITTNSIVNKDFSLLDYTQKEVDTMVDDPYLPLRGVQIPYWKKILRIAVESQKLSQLGFTGVDIAIDRKKGPVIFELNARPGLAIQICNKTGLKERLERVEGLNVKSIDQGLEIAKTLFGGEVEREIESISGKQIIAPLQKIKLYGQIKSKKTHKKRRSKKYRIKETIKARMDTGKYYSYISEKTLVDLGYRDLLQRFSGIKAENKKETKELAEKLLAELKLEKAINSYELKKVKEGYKAIPKFRIQTNIEGINKKITFKTRKREQIAYPARLGRKDLKYFLIDPSRRILGN